MKKKYIIIGIVVIILDQLLKVLMINKNITIIPNFLKFTYVQNEGGAFGIGDKFIVLIISIIIVIGFLIYYIKQRSKINNHLPFILIISGSLGNIIDRIFRGYVIDYIDVNVFSFPKFNLADICIVTGIFLLMYQIIRKILINKS